MVLNVELGYSALKAHMETLPDDLVCVLADLLTVTARVSFALTCTSTWTRLEHACIDARNGAQKQFEERFGAEPTWTNVCSFSRKAMRPADVHVLMFYLDYTPRHEATLLFSKQDNFKGKLHLHFNQLAAEGAIALSRVLLLLRHRMRFILDVSLHSNAIGDKGTRYLMSAVRCGALPCLETLGLSHNLITDDGVSALAYVIDAGWLQSLRHISLARNCVTCIGIHMLAAAFDTGNIRNLKYLGLGSNQIGTSGAVRIAQTIASTTSLPLLCELWLGSNPRVLTYGAVAVVGAFAKRMQCGLVYELLWLHDVGIEDDPVCIRNICSMLEIGGTTNHELVLGRLCKEARRVARNHHLNYPHSMIRYFG